MSVHRNSSGAYDPTAGDALSHITHEERMNIRQKLEKSVSPRKHKKKKHNGPLQYVNVDLLRRNANDH